MTFRCTLMPYVYLFVCVNSGKHACILRFSFQLPKLITNYLKSYAVHLNTLKKKTRTHLQWDFGCTSQTPLTSVQCNLPTKLLPAVPV